MVKVITYGSFDMLHYGHIRLLERAKELGDYLVVGVTSDDYDKQRGKINLQQSLMERVEAVKATGIPDEVIVEEYEGQKIDDIKKFHIDIFTVGSDWVGYFDYLDEYCNVVYLPRTEGISSSEIRSANAALKIGLAGSASFLEKIVQELSFVNGLELESVYSPDINMLPLSIRALNISTDDYDALLERVDAVYVHSTPEEHYSQVRKALLKNKHVLCESPIALSSVECDELYEIANNHGVILMEAIKTAYSTAYQRLLLLIKAGKIGRVLSVDSVCTSLKSISDSPNHVFNQKWNSITTWGPTSLLPVFQILGPDYLDKTIITHFEDDNGSDRFDLFTKINFVFKDSTATIKVGRGVKSEGELVISGTKGYIYVPAPWWKTDYFEVRYENPSNNKRYFYQLDGEGIRYEFVAFSKAITSGFNNDIINKDVTRAISSIMGDFNKRIDLIEI